MALERIRKLLPRVLASALSAIPYAGQFYSTFRSDVSTDEVKQLLSDIMALNESQKNELLSQILVTKDALYALTEQLEKFISQPQINKLVAIVPVGGRGGSMFPITSVMPKCLVYVGERTMLQHILNSFVPFPDIFRKVIVITRAFNSAIKENIRQGGYGQFVECINIDKQVPAALLELRGEIENGPFLLHYNDILIPSIDWNEVYEKYSLACKHRNISAMLLCSSYYPVGVGVVSEREPDILGTFEEKPLHMQSSSLANIGVAIFSRKLLDFIHGDDVGIFEESFKRFFNGCRSDVGLLRITKWDHVHELKDLYEIQKKRGELT